MFTYCWKRYEMALTSLKTGGLLSVIILILAVYYKRSNDEYLETHIHEVLDGLLRAERKVQQDQKTKVAVGFGACFDYYTNATQLLDSISVEPSSSPEHYTSINSKGELAQLVAYFFGVGAAAERYIKNKVLWQEMLQGAQGLPYMRTTVGGNAPVMAKRFITEGFDVLLGARISKKLANMISPDMKVAGGDLMEDDVHISLEYKTGEKWGPYTSPRANRIFLHSDQTNPYINALEEFQIALREFNPKLLVIGGLQMLDHFPFELGERESRLQKLSDMLRTTQKETLVHFEMASFTEETLMLDLADYLIPYSDSLGMNEQELPNIVSILTYRNITVLSDPYPRVATVLDQMRELYSLLEKFPETKGRRKVSRLHIHTLPFQAILTRRNSAWKNTMSATAKAALMGIRHVCNSSHIDLHKSKLIMDESFSTTTDDKFRERIPLNSNRPVSCWEEGDYQICVAPNLVCTDVVQTGGGGDNISSAGLVLQI
ncbi:unnamed protein product [Owenia fusiformis]|uniref:Uncharacterized protein n=1 Tax=Owenia fusiformis TaxID=6347 RepID=A0A8J1U5M9_OWEFU|nr:unnamed protein product [Owenia fusiformis]